MILKHQRTDNCGRCRFFELDNPKQIVQMPYGLLASGHCHKKAPPWQFVWTDDWCDEFKDTKGLTLVPGEAEESLEDIAKRWGAIP